MPDNTNMPPSNETTNADDTSIYLLQPITNLPTLSPLLADDLFTQMLPAIDDTVFASSQPIANNLPPFNRLIGCGG